MQIGSVYIDISATQVFLNTNSTPALVALFMAVLGWIIIIYLLLFMGLYLLEEYKRKKYKKDWNWVLLAIDVPQLNVQTPKAIEQLFSHLAGAQYSPNIVEKFRHGYQQRWFSFEIVSIEGYIQFLIRTEEIFRDLVEAAVYAQYPEAEITEVEDYTAEFPDKFPDEDYDMWGADFGLAENFSYPIRTYTEFEHSIAEDNILKDPMGTFLESFSRIGQGEQVWFQILIEPTDNSWKEEVIKKIKDMVGDVGSFASSKKSGLASVFLGEPSKILTEINTQVLGGGVAADAAGVAQKGPENKLLQLTPGQRKLLESMEDKITKIGFKTKMRVVYLARKEVFRPERSVNALIGAINQFNNPSSNSIIPTSTVKTDYFLKKTRNYYRKGMTMRAYKKRKMLSGGNPFVFNIEELATIWHFPLSHVKTPLLQKTQGKKTEPPIGLPVESVNTSPSYLYGEEKSVEETKEQNKIITDAGDVAYTGDEEYG